MQLEAFLGAVEDASAYNHGKRLLICPVRGHRDGLERKLLEPRASVWRSQQGILNQDLPA
jgi:hypothetical protein